MKVFLFLLSLILSSTISFSQSVNGVALKDLNVEYVQIVGSSKLFSNDVTVQIDFGQKNKVFSSKDTRIVDADGKDVVLHSMIDALNFMYENGYEFVNAFAITMGNVNVYHYVMKRKSDK